MIVSHLHDERGILYPTKLPTFHRVAAPEFLRDRVRWFWIPVWELPPGSTSRQVVLPYPASNLVVQPDGVTLTGPTTGVSHRDLSGVGWAVGALLRPAGIAALHPNPRAICNADMLMDTPELHRAVAEAMRVAEEAARVRATVAFTTWLDRRCASPDVNALLANKMEDVIAGDRAITRVDQVAEKLAMSVRGVQRLAERYVGLAPLAIIRRYRLQEAAQRLRDDPTLTIARVAADLGYADHAHLSTDFREVLGLTPSSYRRDPDHGGRSSSRDRRTGGRL